MRKSTFIVYGLVALVFVVVIPWIAFQARGNADSGVRAVPANLKAGQSIFANTCGACHTLASAGADGDFGPNLDELLAPSGPLEGSAIEQTEKLVHSVVEEGIDTSTTPGRMPAGLLNPTQAKEVAAFVAHTAGE